MKGNCQICGNFGDLTKEHIPPKKAFNDKRTISFKGIETLKIDPDNPPKRKKFLQGGISYYTLMCKMQQRYRKLVWFIIY